MSKIISVALIVLLGVFIVNNVKDIVEKVKAKKAEKAQENEKECGTTESKEE